MVDGIAKRLNACLEAVRAVLSVDRSYLDEAFKAIDHHYGSVDHYRRAELTLSDLGLVKLKTLLLEP